MAQEFNAAVVTTEGLALITQALAGEIELEFTRLSIGDGSYTDEEKETESLQAMTALKSYRNSYSLNSISQYSDTALKIKAYISNRDPSTLESVVDEGYYINEMGLFAQAKDDSGTEVLFSISVVSGDTGDYLPAYTGNNPVQIVQEYYTWVSNSGIAASITENSDAFALAADLAAARKELATAQEEITALQEAVDELNGNLNIIGTTKINNATVSVDASTVTQICSLQLDAGTWIVNARACFSGNFSANARAALNISTIDAVTYFGCTNSVQGSSAHGYYGLEVTRILEYSSETTVYASLFQNCGETKSVDSCMSAIRIA